MRADNAADIKTQEKDDEFKLKHHQLTVKGKAEDSGLILTNASGDKDGLTAAQREKKKSEKEASLRNLLDASREALEERLDTARKGIKATEKLKDLYKKGELDYHNPEHILLLQQAGLTEEEIEGSKGQAIWDKQREWKEEARKTEAKLNQNSELSRRAEESPDSPELKSDIEEFLNDKDDVWSLAELEDDTLEDATGFSFEESDGFGNDDISFASTASPEGGIKAESINKAFNNAANGIENTSSNDYSITKQPSLETAPVV